MVLMLINVHFKIKVEAIKSEINKPISEPL